MRLVVGVYEFSLLESAKLPIRSLIGNIYTDPCKYFESRWLSWESRHQLLSMMAALCLESLQSEEIARLECLNPCWQTANENRVLQCASDLRVC